MIDLEDAVPAAAKDEARRSTVDILRDRPADGPPVWVRVNPPTEAVGRADVDALAGMPVDGLRLPRCEDPAVVHAVAEQTGDDLYLSARDRPRPAGAPASWPARIRAVRGVGLGEADLAADLLVAVRLGAGLGPGPVVAASRARRARRRRSRASRPTSATSTGLRTTCDGRPGHGFFGRSVVHPSADPVVHEVFTPSPEEVAEAARGARHRCRGPSPWRGGRPDARRPLRRPRGRRAVPARPRPHARRPLERRPPTSRRGQP